MECQAESSPFSCHTRLGCHESSSQSRRHFKPCFLFVCLFCFVLCLFDCLLVCFVLFCFRNKTMKERKRCKCWARVTEVEYSSHRDERGTRPRDKTLFSNSTRSPGYTSNTASTWHVHAVLVCVYSSAPHPPPPLFPSLLNPPPSLTPYSLPPTPGIFA